MNRIDKFRKKISASKFDGGFLTSETDILYLTGFEVGGILYIDEREVIIYVSGVNYNAASDMLGNIADVRLYKTEPPFREFAKAHYSKKIFFERRGVSHLIATRLIRAGFKAASIMGSLRILKEEVEIEKIRTSCRLAAKVVDSIEPESWRGRTEVELAGYLEREGLNSGASGRAFRTIVAAGVNSSYPHHNPSTDLIRTGILKIDYGLRVKGYCSDLTRTFILTKFVSNFESEWLKEAVENAKQAAVRMLRPGIRCSSVHAAALDVLEDYGLGSYFIHGVGHGLGLDIHEEPRLSPGSDTLLRESMVVTVEPGVYIRGHGGLRIEDTYLIKTGGSERLTSQFQ